MTVRTQAIGGCPFCYVCDIRPRRDQAGRVLLDRPQPRYGNRKGLGLHPYGAGAFCEFRIPADLPYAGVYALIVNSDEREVRLVGECINLSGRFNQGYGRISPRNCFEDGQQTNCRINQRILETVTRGDSVELWFLKTAERKRTESDLISLLRPPWNIHGKP